MNIAGSVSRPEQPCQSAGPSSRMLHAAVLLRAFAPGGTGTGTGTEGTTCSLGGQHGGYAAFCAMLDQPRSAGSEAGPDQAVLELAHKTRAVGYAVCSPGGQLGVHNTHTVVLAPAWLDPDQPWSQHSGTGPVWCSMQSMSRAGHPELHAEPAASVPAHVPDWLCTLHAAQGAVLEPQVGSYGSPEQIHPFICTFDTPGLDKGFV